MSKKSLLVTLADANYVEQAKQLFSSVYWNAGWKGDYMLLSHQVPEAKLKWFREKGILVKNCKPLYRKPVGMGRYPPVNLDKFYLFIPEFREWENVLYLDADIIIRGSLESLERVKGFAATHMEGIRLRQQLLYGKAGNPGIGRLLREVEAEFDVKRRIFNSGVMAFSTGIIEENSFSVLMGLFHKYHKINYGADENPLNMYFHGKWKQLPCTYNLFPSLLLNKYGVRAGNIDGIALHFMKEKPWLPGSPFHREWKANLKKAKAIDLGARKSPKRVWNEREQVEYCKYLKWKMRWSALPNFIKKCLGLLGIRIKRVAPALYYYLKAIERRLSTRKKRALKGRHNQGLFKW